MPTGRSAPIHDQNRPVHVVQHAARDDRLASEILVAEVRRGDLCVRVVIVPLGDEDAGIGAAFECAGVQAVNVDRVVRLGGDDVGAIGAGSVFVRAGIGDQRPPAAVKLEVQEVKVPVDASFGAGIEDDLVGGRV